jgi:succinate dehydrogenase/fumarate reductase-like Fe-S protein
MRNITATIKRTTDEGAPYYQDFTVAFEEDDVISVMNVMEKIFEEKDPSLAFFSHAACLQAVCGKCIAKINGQNRLMCKEKVTTEHITVEPYSNNVLRDLICR